MRTTVTIPASILGLTLDGLLAAQQRHSARRRFPTKSSCDRAARRSYLLAALVDTVSPVLIGQPAAIVRSVIQQPGSDHIFRAAYMRVAEQNSLEGLMRDLRTGGMA